MTKIKHFGELSDRSDLQLVSTTSVFDKSFGEIIQSDLGKDNWLEKTSRIFFSEGNIPTACSSEHHRISSTNLNKIQNLFTNKSVLS